MNNSIRGRRNKILAQSRNNISKGKAPLQEDENIVAILKENKTVSNLRSDLDSNESDELLNNFINNMGKIFSLTTSSLQNNTTQIINNTYNSCISPISYTSTSLAIFEPLLSNVVTNIKGIWAVIDNRYIIASYKDEPGYIISIDNGPNFEKLKSSEIKGEVCSKLEVEARPNRCYLYNNYLYVSTDSGHLHIVSLADPTNLTLVGSTLGINSQMFSVVVSDDESYAFGSDAVSSGILVFDIKDKTKPRYIHAIPFKAGSLIYHKNHIIVTDFGENKLRIYDATDAPTLHLRGVLENFQVPVSIFKDPYRELVYIGSYDSDRLWCVDITDVKNPEFCSEVKISGNKQPHLGSVNFRNNFLYITSNNGYVTIVDVTTSSMSVAGNYSLGVKNVETSFISTIGDNDYFIIPIRPRSILIRKLNYNEAVYIPSSVVVKGSIISEDDLNIGSSSEGPSSSRSSSSENINNLYFNCKTNQKLEFNLTDGSTISGPPNHGTLKYLGANRYSYLPLPRFNGTDIISYKNSSESQAFVIMDVQKDINADSPLIAAAGNDIYILDEKIENGVVSFTYRKLTTVDVNISALTFNSDDQLIYYISVGDSKIYAYDVINKVSFSLIDVNTSNKFMGAPGICLDNAGITYTSDILYVGIDSRTKHYYRIVLGKYIVTQDSQEIISVTAIKPYFSDLENISMCWNSHNSHLLVAGTMGNLSHLFVCDAEGGTVIRDSNINILKETPKIAFGSNKNLYMIYPHKKIITILDSSTGKGTELASLELDGITDIC